MNTKKALLLVSLLVILIGLIGSRPAASRATSHIDGAMGSGSRTTVQADAPVIAKATIEKKQLIIEGENFGEGAKLFVDGAKVKVVPDEVSPTTKLIVNKANKRLPVDEIVGLQVKNPDGQLSAIQMFFTGLTLTYQNTNTGFGITIQAGRKFLLYFNEPLISWALFDPPQSADGGVRPKHPIHYFQLAASVSGEATRIHVFHNGWLSTRRASPQALGWSCG